MALLGPGQNASFEFHLGNWLGADNDGAPIRPEVEKLADTDVLCLYGRDESDSLCPTVVQPEFEVHALPGGHHFGGDYAKLAALVVGGL